MNDKILYKGKEYTKKELACKFQIKYGTFIVKLTRGWTLEEIENNCHLSKGYGIEINGVKYSSKKQACDELNLTYRELNRLINNKPKRDNSIEINGIKYSSKREAKEKLKCSSYTLNKLINQEITEIRKELYIIDNKEFTTKKEIANYYNKNYGSFLNKLKLGWTIEQIVGLEKEPEKININDIDLDKLSKENNISKDIIIKKIKRGYTLEKALQPLKNINNIIVCNGIQFNSKAELADYYNKSRELIYNRLNIGWSPEEAVELKKRN